MDEEGVGRGEDKRGEEMKMIPPKTPTKRKAMKEEKGKKSPKKRRQNSDMKRSISCKRWREEGSRVQLEQEQHHQREEGTEKE